MTDPDNRWFEALTIVEIARHPTKTWADMTALWRQLPRCPLSTQSRIIARMIEEAAGRGDPLSEKFVRRFAKHAVRVLAPRYARDGIHDVKGCRLVASWLAADPKASLGELAAIAEVPRDTIRRWKKLPEFQRFKRDAALALDLNKRPAKLWSTRSFTEHTDPELKKLIRLQVQGMIRARKKAQQKVDARKKRARKKQARSKKQRSGL
jgi:hypothetical protein